MEAIARTVFYISAVLSAFVHNPLHNPFGAAQSTATPAPAAQQTAATPITSQPASAHPTEEAPAPTQPAPKSVPVTVKTPATASTSTAATKAASSVRTNTQPKTSLSPSEDPEFFIRTYYGELHAYDAYGYHIGLATTTYEGVDIRVVEEHIPGGYYLESGSGAYIFYPAGRNGRIEIHGTAKGTTDLELISENKTIGVYKNIPLQPGSVAKLPVLFSGDKATIGPLADDVDGDGLTDIVIHGEDK